MAAGAETSLALGAASSSLPSLCLRLPRAVVRFSLICVAAVTFASIGFIALQIAAINAVRIFVAIHVAASLRASSSSYLCFVFSVLPVQVLSELVDRLKPRKILGHFGHGNRVCCLRDMPLSRDRYGVAR